MLFLLSNLRNNLPTLLDNGLVGTFISPITDVIDFYRLGIHEFNFSYLNESGWKLKSINNLNNLFDKIFA